MTEQGGEIIYTDMSVCRPEGSLARQWKENSRLLVEDEAFDDRKGIMAFADPVLRGPGDRTVSERRGSLRIHLGINYTKSTYAMVYSGYSRYGELQAKLSEDLGFSRVGAEPASSLDPATGERGSKLGKGKFVTVSIQDTHWKTADLTGQSLFFRPRDLRFQNRGTGASPIYRGSGWVTSTG